MVYRSEEGARLVSQNSKRAIALAVEDPGPYTDDGIFRRQLKYEAVAEFSFPSVGGDEVELLSREPTEGGTSDNREGEEQED
ncbi:MAG: hypothetical protein CMO12_00720 [Thaumarchaeota archaeon]|jgi:hypothetical protein|nr:hypothetical protein [Nitrososphaerota archaeon]|tara:strand:- start:326 stop:571 length:246 start_codon:yes stop_codon:yes gene_type:complete